MGKKWDEYKRSKVTIFGFSWQTKTFLTTIGLATGVLLILVAMTLLGVNISWYGVMVGLGFLVALALCQQLCPERDINRDYPYTLIWWIFPFSIVGARIYFLIFDGITEFMDIIRIWDGGLAIYGGVIGGFLGLVIASLIHKVNIVKTCDVVAPVLSIGQAFGRIGCIFGKCCYGVAVTNKSLQWFPIALYVHGGYHYATNFYESILDLCLFVILVIVLRKVKITGLVTFSYMFGYGLIRFILESFRDQTQTLFIGNYPVSKLLSLVLIIVGVIGICTLLLVNNRKKGKEKPISDAK